MSSIKRKALILDVYIADKGKLILFKVNDTELCGFLRNSNEYYEGIDMELNGREVYLEYINRAEDLADVISVEELEN